MEGTEVEDRDGLRSIYLLSIPITLPAEKDQGFKPALLPGSRARAFFDKG